MNFEWRNSLCCPKCRTPVKFASPIICGNCGSKYLVLADRPIFLDLAWDRSEQEKFVATLSRSKGATISLPQSASWGLTEWRKFFFTSIFPRLDPRDPQWEFLFESAMAMRERIRKNAKVIDIGAGECKYRMLLPDADYVSFDFAQSGSQYDFSKLDFIADAQKIPIADSTFDYAVNFAVLEHVPDPFCAVKEMARVLRSGGECFCIVPLTRPEHMVPFDFFRYTQFGIKEVFGRAGLSIEAIRPSNGSLWTAVHYLYQTACTFPLQKFGRRSLRGIAESILMRVLLSPLVVYARLSNKRYSAEFPIYYYVHAKKV